MTYAIALTTAMLENTNLVTSMISKLKRILTKSAPCKLVRSGGFHRFETLTQGRHVRASATILRGVTKRLETCVYSAGAISFGKKKTTNSESQKRAW